jgi:hypothetical protein
MHAAGQQYSAGQTVQASRSSCQYAEGVVAGRKWSDLSQRTRRLIIVGAAVETSLKVAALVDMKRRPASEIRGKKWMWVPALTILNSAGLAPLAYFLLGRRRG